VRVARHCRSAVVGGMAAFAQGPHCYYELTTSAVGTLDDHANRALNTGLNVVIVPYPKLEPTWWSI
jgi:hypothetical protein